MVDGKATGDRKEPTITLIVAPTHLIEHWYTRFLILKLRQTLYLQATQEKRVTKTH